MPTALGGPNLIADRIPVEPPAGAAVGEMVAPKGRHDARRLWTKGVPVPLGSPNLATRSVPIETAPSTPVSKVVHPWSLCGSSFGRGQHREKGRCEAGNCNHGDEYPVHI